MTRTRSSLPVRWQRRALQFVALLLSGPLFVTACGDIDLSRDWRSASRASVGLAPDAATTGEAVIQVYAARTVSWRGSLAVHTWIATKPAQAAQYHVHQVVGWRKRRGLPVISSAPDIPDRLWFGAQPALLLDIRGARAEALIPRIMEAVSRYPYPDDYRVWPGPNSNTFTAFVARAVPDLALDLPVTAIGKDYLPGNALLGRAPSGTGYQLSVAGALGILAAQREGLELNLLGLAFGVDVLRPALKLPGVGRIGMSDTAN